MTALWESLEGLRGFPGGGFCRPVAFVPRFLPSKGQGDALSS